MILVLLGTQNNSFHRLLEEVEKNIINKTIDEEVVVQAGYTKYESNNMKIFDFISHENLDLLEQKADIIITHGGVGSIIGSIKKGKKVIAVARQHEYGEHVNNHQDEIVELFNDKGYIIGIKDVQKLKKALKKAKVFEPKEYISDNSKLLNIVDKFIQDNI